MVDYDDETVLAAIESLREKRLVLIVTGSGRVTKYGQRLSETLNLGRRELAVLCTLLLRGQQTLGEIKDRSERMFSFADLAEVEHLLQKLEELPEGGLVRKLPRQPGQKEARYTHLFSGEPAADDWAARSRLATKPPPESQCWNRNCGRCAASLKN